MNDSSKEACAWKITPDGFLFQNRSFYPLGVNYWPRDSAVYQWKEYNPTAIEQEFELMAKIGINTIRMFFMWDDIIGSELNGNYDQEFQKFLPNFQHFHDTAQKYNVHLNPTLFIGHMSGQDWFPSWFYVQKGQKTSEGAEIPTQCIGLPPRKRQRGLVRDFYRDEEVYQFAFAQLDRLLPLFKDSPTIQAWDLSNENQYMMPPRVPEEAQIYMKRMYEKIKSLDPHHPITIGMGKLSEMTGFNSYGPAGFNQFIDYYAIHTYPSFYYPPSIDLVNLYTTYKPGFDIRLAQIAHKPIQFQEFGLSWKVLSWRRKSTEKMLMGGYFRLALWSGWINGANSGSLIWDFSDFANPLVKREPYNHKYYEMFFGVVDNAYRLKPSAVELQKFGNFIKESEKIAPIQRFVPMQSGVGIVVPENYNDLLRPVKSILELTDDTPIDVKKANRQSKLLDEDSLSNQNKSLFSTYLWCRQANLEPHFVTYDDDWSTYKLLFMPNIKHLSEKSIEKVNQFLKNGANGSGGTIYLSSIDTPSNELQSLELKDFTPSKFQKIKRNAKDIVLTPSIHASNPSNLSIFQEKCPQLRFFNNSSQLSGMPRDNAIYYDSATQSPVIVYYPAKYSKGGLIWNSFVPEIQHTKIRSMYKKEQMWHLYRAIAHFASITYPIECADPRLECSLLVDPTTKSTLFVVLNHTKEKITTVVKVFDNLSNPQTISLSLSEFGVHYQFLSK